MFTYLLSLYMTVHTEKPLGTGAQDGHLDFHTAPELCKPLKYVNMVLNVHRHHKAY